MRALLYPLLFTGLAACGAKTDRTGAPGLDDLQGRWAVVNYWAEWCKPCIKEIPELNEAARRFPDVAIVGVNYDGASGEELAAQLEALGVTFPTLAVDPAPELGIPRPAVLPTTLILDPQGVLVQTLVGPQTLESLAQATGQEPVDG